MSLIAYFIISINSRFHQIFFLIAILSLVIIMFFQRTRVNRMIVMRMKEIEMKTMGVKTIGKE